VKGQLKALEKSSSGKSEAVREALRYFSKVKRFSLLRREDIDRARGFKVGFGRGLVAETATVRRSAAGVARDGTMQRAEKTPGADQPVAQ
jgi:hypothetical protein